MSKTIYYVYKQDPFINKRTSTFWLFKAQKGKMLLWKGHDLGWKEERENWVERYKKGFKKISKASACLIMLTGIWNGRKIFRWD